MWLRAGVLVNSDRSDQIGQIGGLHPCVCREISGGHDSTLRLAIDGFASSGAAQLLQERARFMPLIQLCEVLIVVGVLLWLVNRYIPMQSSIKSILNGVVVIVVVLWLLNVFGLFHSLSRVHIGRG
jgi:hypothetical protein